jgi:hypothetical protein
MSVCLKSAINSVTGACGTVGCELNFGQSTNPATHELRTRAGKDLGKKFDVRAFHDAVLGEGAVPLGVIEPHVRRWTGAQLQASRSAN